MSAPILELRVALTAADYDKIVSFYRDGLGLDPAALWTNENGRAEIYDEAHAASIDQIEAGARLSGQIRFALQVPDLEAALARLTERGTHVIHPPVTTPWGHYNARISSPDGLQITLFQVLESSDTLS